MKRTLREKLYDKVGEKGSFLNTFRKGLVGGLVGLAMTGVVAGTSLAEVNDDTCSDCHTSGQSLRFTCVQCHTGVNAGGETPFVHSINEPEFGTNTLAGGNFYWVAQDDSDGNGHNVFGISEKDIFLKRAPGPPVEKPCLNSCHISLAYSEEEQIALPELGTGCKGCHLNPAHHADDTGPIVGAASPSTDGYYRFLSGHNSGDTHGVCGIEDSDWQYTKGADDHNEYLGFSGNKEGVAGFYNLGNTMTAFCCGCHGNFHKEKESRSWIRHPSDAIISNSGEYRNAFGADGSGIGIYDPLVPVARPNLENIEKSEEIQLGADMVMCLSCHFAHGGPYDDLLRWDPNDMIAGESNDGTGCFTCHTEK